MTQWAERSNTPRLSSSQARALLDALMDAAPVGLVVFDAELRLQHVNVNAAALTSRSPADLVGKRVAELVPRLDPMFAQAAEEVIRSGRPSGDFEIELAAGGPRSRSRTLWCRLFAVHVPEEREPVVACVLVDATERHLVELGRAEILARERGARAELERARDRLAFVVHASSRLAASLDIATTLETVGDLMVPRFGSYCLVDFWDGRRLERVFVRGVESADEDLMRQLRELSGMQLPGHPAMQAARSGQSVVITATDRHQAELMYAEAPGPDLVLATTGGHGFASVPLSTRGRIIGVLTLVGPAHSGARDLSAQEDLAVVEQVASRASQSIENAQLFDTERRLARSLQESEQQQRRAAFTLQRSLLPKTTHQPADLEIAVRYLPGTEETEVGGDWYDIIPLARGRTALVIGDVMGRGLRAATLMGQVRTAIRAYARQDLNPKEILELVDGLVADLGEAEIVTCVYGVFDAQQATLTYASAGHPPLLVVEPDGTSRRLDHQTGVPLGVASGAAPEHVVPVPPGTLVAFYTDGLVEHRERDVDAGIDELVQAMHGQAAPLESICDQVIDALRPPSGYDDDVALLFARPYALSGPGGAPPDDNADVSMSMTLDPDLSSAPAARAQADQTLVRWGIGHELRSAIVLTCAELVANALRYGDPPVRLRLRRRRDAISVEVSDGAATPPKRRQPDETDEGGRGLLMVAQLADRWGWMPMQRGKLVWCEHALS